MTTLNPAATLAGITLSNQNLTATGTTNNTDSSTYATTPKGPGSGKWVIGFVITSNGANGPAVGLTSTPTATARYIGNSWLAGGGSGSDVAGSDCAYWNDGTFNVNGGEIGAYTAFTTGGVAYLAVDLTGTVSAAKVWVKFGAAGNWNGSGTNNPDTGVGANAPGFSGAVLAPAISFFNVAAATILPQAYGHGLSTFGAWDQPQGLIQVRQAIQRAAVW